MRTFERRLILCGAFLFLGALLVSAADTDNGTPTKLPVLKNQLPALPPGAPPNVAVPGTNNQGGAKIHFANPVYDFGRVRSGEPVKFTYMFTNIGDAVLELSNVQPQCGCTAAGDWTRRVEPGQAGTIPIQFNTSNYSQPVVKTVTVSCNDKSQPVVVLQLKGTVWKPIELQPPYSVMNVLPDMANSSTVVRIINNTEERLTLSDPEVNNKGFKADLKEIKPGKEYQLTLSAVPPLNPGTVQGKITLKSSMTNTPTLDVPFWANVQAPVMVIPAQFTVPAAPLVNKSTPSVTIQNNTTNALTISDASINVPGAEVTVKELTPGRIFNLQLTLPEGFELPAGQKALVTFKTSNPQHKTMEVPVVQMAKPMTTAQQAPLTQPPQFQRPPIKPLGPGQLPPRPIVGTVQTNAAKLQ